MEAGVFPESIGTLLYHNRTVLSREADGFFNQNHHLWLAPYFDTTGKVKACNSNFTQIWNGLVMKLSSLILISYTYIKSE